MPFRLLFAQAADYELTSKQANTMIEMALAVAGFAVVMLVLIPVFVAMKNTKQAHLERMKLLEMGYLPPTRPSRWPQAFFCSAVGLGVPVGTFFLTWLGSQSLKAPIDIWVAPSVVSVVALLGASLVAGTVFSRPETSAQPERLAAAVGKPGHDADADALDFAGRLNGR